MFSYVFSEESATMSEISDVWFGYLEAGDKSSPVLIDPRLDTGNSNTVYMYNLNSQRIIEYKREIAEPKLRQLKDPEKDLTKDLVRGYESARKEFTPRSNGIAALPASAALSTRKPQSKLDQLATVVGEDEFDVDDADEELDLEGSLDENSESDEDEDEE
jgi:hypothetical protein